MELALYSLVFLGLCSCLEAPTPFKVKKPETLNRELSPIRADIDISAGTMQLARMDVLTDAS